MAFETPLLALELERMLLAPEGEEQMVLPLAHPRKGPLHLAAPRHRQTSRTRPEQAETAPQLVRKLLSLEAWVQTLEPMAHSQKGPLHLVAPRHHQASRMRPEQAEAAPQPRTLR